MSLPSSIISAKLGFRSHHVDARQLMAFAAGVGDARPELIDTARPGGIVPHPVFPVSLEWRSFLDIADELMARGLDRDTVMLADPLHYDLTWHGTISPGDRLVTRPCISGAVRTSEGVVLTLEVSTEHEAGDVVTRSRSRVLFPDVQLDGLPAGNGTEDASVIDLRAEWVNPDAVIRRGHRRVGAAAAHVFSEATGMWNPVFTDKAVALDHGRAFLSMPHAGVLAMAVGGALQLGSADPSWIRRVHAEFGSMVPVPSTLEIEAEVPNRPSASSPLRFRAHLEDGTPVIQAGVLVAEPAEADVDAARARVRSERRRAVSAARLIL